MEKRPLTVAPMHTPTDDEIPTPMRAKRTRERKRKAREDAAQRRREQRALDSALRKEAARQRRREETAKRRALREAAAEHERKLCTLTGVRLQLYRKEHGVQLHDEPEEDEQDAPPAKRLGIVLRSVGPDAEVHDFSDSGEE